MKIYVVALSLILGACSSLVKMPQAEVSFEDAKAAWAQVLKQYVDSDGWVDFKALKANPQLLERYVAFVANSGPQNRPDLFGNKNDALAFHLNAYNALSMFGVLEAGVPKSNSGFSKITFFVFKKYKIAGTVRSLKDYEDNVIRKMDDPRIHFALNCMAVGCPRLPQVAFQGKNLDQQLDAGAKLFFSEKRNFYLDPAKKQAWVSEILKFFPEDFLVKAPTITAYINYWAPEKIPDDYKLKYISYDWTIINQAAKPAR